MIDYLEKEKTINKEYYESELIKMNEASQKEKKLKADIFSLQGYAPVATALSTAAEAANYDFELFTYVPNSLDIRPSGFFLFLQLKSHLHSLHFGINK